MKILLATDGSDFSWAAVDMCTKLITMFTRPSILVVSVYELQVPVAAEPFEISAEHYQKLDEAARKRAEAAAQNALKLICGQYGNKPIDITTRVEFGRPAEALIEAAKEWAADLVIVGSHGRGFWGRLTLGSVSDVVVHHSPCSVLVVRRPPNGSSEENFGGERAYV